MPLKSSGPVSLADDEEVKVGWRADGGNITARIGGQSPCVLWETLGARLWRANSTDYSDRVLSLAALAVVIVSASSTLRCFQFGLAKQPWLAKFPFVGSNGWDVSRLAVGNFDCYQRERREFAFEQRRRVYSGVQRGIVRCAAPLAAQLCLLNIILCHSNNKSFPSRRLNRREIASLEPSSLTEGQNSRATKRHRQRREKFSVEIR